MNYLPYCKFDLVLPLSQEEVKSRICGGIQGFEWKSLVGKYSKPFQGTVENGYFELKRNISYRNWFLPVLSGTLSDSNGATEVKVVARMELVIEMLMVFWIGGGIYLLGKSLYMPTTTEGWAAALVSIFGYIIMQYGFWSEVSRSRKQLEEIING
jgi:hypothetical protein